MLNTALAKRTIGGMKMGKRLTILVAAILGVATLPVLLWAAGNVRASPPMRPLAQGGAPLLLNYQGRLADPATGLPEPDGDYHITFRIYDDEVWGSLIWSEEQVVMVSGGLFNALLGSSTPLSASDFGDTLRWLELEVEGETLSPRMRVGSVPYAIQTEEVENAWALTGNGGTDPAGQFLGTTDSQPLVLKTDGVEAMRIGSFGDVGIGIPWPSAKLHVDGGTFDALRVDSTGAGGVIVNANDDGVRVNSAGSPSATSYSPQKNGFEVAGAEGYGLWVGRADWHGVAVDSANSVGVRISSAGVDGVYVASAGNDGISVGMAGSPTTTETSSEKNGLEVAGAEGHGLFVGRADLDGVRVQSAKENGVMVWEPDFDGVSVVNAGRDGIWASATNWAGYFGGDVRITGACDGCSLAAFARNAGEVTLEPGDVVAVRGMTRTDLQDPATVMEVGLATGPDALIGVVAGRAEPTRYESHQDEAETVRRLVPREGPAQPGEYVKITTYGLTQVKASAVAAPIQPGTRLTAADQAGHARVVKTVSVQGVQVAENTPVLGIALEGIEGGQGLIWVLVNPR
jgi:hypothetical protein